MRVALLGCGTVGAEVVRLLHTSGDDLTARVGAPLELAGIAVRRLGRARDLPVPDELFTTDAAGWSPVTTSTWSSRSSAASSRRAR
jgi:homoserine dehydrogenase